MVTTKKREIDVKALKEDLNEAMRQGRKGNMLDRIRNIRDGIDRGEYD